MASIVVEVVNKKGLHARAAAKFVRLAEECRVPVSVVKLGGEGEGDSHSVAGSSILGLMMLGADPGSRLCLSAEGEGAQAAVEALAGLISNRFGEAE